MPPSSDWQKAASGQGWCRWGSLAMKQKQPARVGRRLAAIVAADVVGYSRLMGLDEVGTARTLRARRLSGKAVGIARRSAVVHRRPCEDWAMSRRLATVHPTMNRSSHD